MLGLIVFIPGFDEPDKTSTVNAHFKIIDGGIGERLTVEMIWSIDVENLPADPEKKGYVKLIELQQFIEAYRRTHPQRN